MTQRIQIPEAVIFEEPRTIVLRVPRARTIRVSGLVRFFKADGTPTRTGVYPALALIEWKSGEFLCEPEMMDS